MARSHSMRWVLSPTSPRLKPTPSWPTASVHWSVKQARELAASHRGATDAAAASPVRTPIAAFQRCQSHDLGGFHPGRLRRGQGSTDRPCVLGRIAEFRKFGQFRQFTGSSGSSGPDGGAKVGEEDPLGYVTFDQRLYDGSWKCVEQPAGRPPALTALTAPTAPTVPKAPTFLKAPTAGAATAPRARVKTPAADGADIAPPWLCTPIWDFSSVRIRAVAPTWPV